MAEAFDVDYLAIAPAIHNGIGVGFITMRPRAGSLRPLSFSFQRAALERLRDDINSLLDGDSALSSPRTKNKAILEQVKVQPEVLERFGLHEFEYDGGTE